MGQLVPSSPRIPSPDPPTVERRDLIASGIRERGLALLPQAVRLQAAPIALGVGASLAGLQLVVVESAR